MNFVKAEAAATAPGRDGGEGCRDRAAEITDRSPGARFHAAGVRPGMGRGGPGI